MFINENYLKLQHKLKSDRQVVKVGDDSSGLLLKDNRVYVEEQPSDENEVATKKYVNEPNDLDLKVKRIEKKLKRLEKQIDGLYG